MNTPAVSILVPIYNVSNYIERCAHSLFQQTFSDIEYIFVNDCTPDDSIEKLQKVIEQYPDRKPFVKIVNHDKNRGSSAARNTAINNSNGQYIQYIDSDDWVELDMVEKMYEKVVEENADIVVCDFVIEKQDSKEFQKDFVPENAENYFISIITGKSGCSLWNKLINKKLYKIPDCRSIEGLNYAEDFHLTTRLYYYADKIVKIDTPFYHYNKTNENAITHKKNQMHFEEAILFWQLLEQFFKKNNIYEKYFDLIEFHKVQSKLNLIIESHSHKLRKQYAYLYRDIEMKYFSQFRFGEKIILFCTHYRLFLLVRIARNLLVFKNKKIKK